MQYSYHICKAQSQSININKDTIFGDSFCLYIVFNHLYRDFFFFFFKLQSSFKMFVLGNLHGITQENDSFENNCAKGLSYCI